MSGNRLPLICVTGQPDQPERLSNSPQRSAKNPASSPVENLKPSHNISLDLVIAEISSPLTALLSALSFSTCLAGQPIRITPQVCERHLPLSAMNVSASDSGNGF